MIPLLNHLWQSTLFAGGAGLLAFSLRGNHARIRHSIWLAASLKFLVPFALLIALGGRFAPLLDSQTPTAAPAANLSYFFDEAAAPFTAPASHVVPAAPGSAMIPLTALLLAIWARGFAGIVWRWWSDWRRMRTLVRAGDVLDLELPIEVRSTPASIEPGVFGIWRPVLLLPEGIAAGLTPAQFRAVVAHELCHVRRRDNLAAALHMAVEAIFWFHPLVRWIGAHLIEERERACDEEVIQQGAEPEIYAESILAACKLYLRSPLPCVSGVAGADLVGRVERIVAGQPARDLSARKRFLVATCAAAALAGPIGIGLATAPSGRAQDAPGGSFEVASIKASPPNVRGMSANTQNGTLVMKNTPVEWLIAQANEVYPYRLANVPAWTKTARYDIEAKAANPKASKAEIAGMLRTLLADRFHLSLHREKREGPVYSLIVGKGGPKLNPPEHPDGPHGVDYRNGGTILIGRNASMEELAESLSFRMERQANDKTGLSGRYDFRLEFTPDEFVRRFGEENATPIDADGTGLFTAIQEQLGLKLEAGRGAVDMIVIDRVERPTEN